MQKSTTPTQIKDYDSEDLEDILILIQDALGIKFGRGELAHVKTYGDLCEAIFRKLPQAETHDCTAQQAFYKLRESIHKVRLIDNKDIIPDASLEALFPREDRRLQISRIKNDLGMQLSILKPKGWVTNILFLGLVAAIVELFFNWKYGLVGLTCMIGLFWIARRLGREFAMLTIGALTKTMVSSHYRKSRRNPSTFNKKEVQSLINDLFVERMGLDLAVLTAEAPLF
jgi:hypothetical protein